MSEAIALPPDLRSIVERQAHEAELARAREAKRDRNKRLCRLAALTIETLKAPPSVSVAADVATAVQSAGAGVEALAVFEHRLRMGERPTDEERDRAREALALGEVERALEEVGRIVREADQARKAAGSRR